MNFLTRAYRSNLPDLDINRLSQFYTAEESPLTKSLAQAVRMDAKQNENIKARASKWVNFVRSFTQRSSVIDAFLQEYGLSTNEGIILMRLSEALIRTPDFTTAQELMRDKLSAGQWNAHTGGSPTTLINAATAGLRFSSAWIMATGGNRATKLAAKLGDRLLHTAVVRGMSIMAGHFVMGSSIRDAVQKAKSTDTKDALYSFDMLGEAAATAVDAERYYTAYMDAVSYLAESAAENASVATAHGLSVKLSALHPRYEYAKRSECVPILIKRVKSLALIAKQAGVGLTLDAEEADRLELSLDIFMALLNDPDLANWDGLGIVVQAYQRRATVTIDAIVDAANIVGRAIAIRLVKGAYWDAEIKRAQEMGLNSYPVFTRKENTDVSYLACAAKLLAAGPNIYPQFATHNAHTAAAIIEMAGSNINLEFQRLHGMGEALHAEISHETGIRSRVYAPVGKHKELLPYLVRRLLENGANSSFVNQLLNPQIEIDEIIRDPIGIAKQQEFSAHPAIPAPRDMFAGTRKSALGIDLTQSATARSVEATLPLKSQFKAASLINGTDTGSERFSVFNPASTSNPVGEARIASNADIEHAIKCARNSNWHKKFTPQMRADCLLKTASLLEERMDELMGLCVIEAGKTFLDAIAEIREAIDFCRYYADQAISPRITQRNPVGVIACISPWNFPLAIFLGQVTASLAAGNTVIAKPALQTPLIAYVAVKILYEAGVPVDAVQLIIGGGDIGEQIVGNRSVDAVCFTGSTTTAQHIAATRERSGKADSVFIAETGGINAMVVDSTALLEQAVADVISSAFQSAGQRCSACRLVCIQEDVADDFEKMLSGAIALLALGNPALLTTDVGPIIDLESRNKIADYVGAGRSKFRVIGEAPVSEGLEKGYFIRPIALAVSSISDVSQEIFGPVLHVVRFAAKNYHDIIDQINALGFGLTLGIHSRIDARIKAVAVQAKVGNLYINRNQIGAVVGVQPFGGEGLSGTGPKAGGPHYMLRLSQPKDANRLSANFDQTLAGYNKRFANVVRKQDLPGPTGEQNSLTLVPRGSLILAGDTEQLAAQVYACLASGNKGVVPAELYDEASKLLSSLKKFDLDIGAVIRITDVTLPELLNSAIDGVIAEGSNRSTIASILAHRPGAIIPLLSTFDDPERYFHERTLTIDTTAAGGNASLLAMQSPQE